MNRKIKKVVLLSNNPDAVGGITTFVNTLAPGLRDSGYDVELVTVEHMTDEGEYLLDTSFVHHVGVAAAMPKKRNFKRARDYFNPIIYYNRIAYRRLKREACRNLSELYNTWGRDTVLIITQVYGAEHLINGRVSLDSNHGPFVIGMYHGSFEEADRTKTIPRLRSSFADVDKFLCLTEFDATEFRRVGFTNSGFIHNPVRIKPARKLPQKENLIVSLGRYHHEKSLDYLIRAWAEIADKHPDWRVELYGSGEEQAKLQRIIDDLGISQQTNLMGKTNDVGGVLARASINALSSQHEGLPLVIIESARFAVPTVSFDCAPGISELIDNGRTGVITPRNNSHLLGVAISDLIQDDEKRNSMGLAAQEDSTMYNVPNIVNQWEEEFCRLVV